MTQREVLEEYRRRAVQQRTTEPFGATDDVDQAALVQRLEHAADRDAANLLDLGAADRLTIRDDRERLERGAGQSRRTRRELRALDRFGVFGARQDLPAAADLDELDAVSVDVVVLAQFVERGLQLRRATPRGRATASSSVAMGRALANSAASSSFASGVTRDFHVGKWFGLSDSQLAELRELEQAEERRENLPRFGAASRRSPSTECAPAARERSE